jgi:hypothetical protein
MLSEFLAALDFVSSVETGEAGEFEADSGAILVFNNRVESRPRLESHQTFRSPGSVGSHRRLDPTLLLASSTWHNRVFAPGPLAPPLDV